MKPPEAGALSTGLVSCMLFKRDASQILATLIEGEAGLTEGLLRPALYKSTTDRAAKVELSTEVWPCC